MRGLLDPKMDFVFKNIFGSEKHPNILISFLNATLKPKDLITEVEIKNTDLNKGYIEDKFSRLDVKATSSNNEIINIEIQLKNEYNMIEIPKLEDGSDEKDMLVAWIEFLKNPESEKVRSLEMSVDEIREAKDELIKMSNDDTQRELYEMRAKTLRDKISALNEAERKGIKKGREEGRKEGEQNKAIEIAKSLINLGLDKESIAKSTGLDLCEVEKLMN